MIHSGQKLFGRPIVFIEPAESLGGEKNLPAVEVPQSEAKRIGDSLCERLEEIKPDKRK